jgi:HD-GYP domain-containing protein (c-di-GMP phosphodiesterase class II)
MPPENKKIKLIYFVIVTLLLVGLVPLVLTGWFLSDKSAKELRAVENRYQTQLVQEKANQLEIVALRYRDLVGSYAKAIELNDNLAIISSPQTEEKFSQTLKDNPNVVALFVKPMQGDSLSVFRSEMVEKSEIENFAGATLANLQGQKFVFGETQKIESSGEIVFTVAAPVIINGELAAAVMAVVSSREILRVMDAQPMSEPELWDSGLPMLFVVDKTGRAVFHPDKEVVANQKKFDDLKIVEEWKQTSAQIQSALFPFEAIYNGDAHEMIGAYSTASFSKDVSFGVIAMQDEGRALASVGEMRRQTWMISLAFALLALLIGSFFARQLTSPLLKLVAAAQLIAGGDLSTRVETKNVTEIGTLGETFNMMTDNLEEYIAKLARSAEENRELFVGTVKALAAAIDGKDRYTRGHSERVCRVSVAIGQRLGMGEEELETLRISALLHDVGKIGIDDSILKKPAALTDEEYAIMKTHPQQGYKIMKNIPAMKEFLPGMYMHHEMINGEGYPQGLKGDQIPLQAKIVSVADTFDAMTIDRPYSKGMDLKAALDRIGTFVGTRYDAKVVEALVQACKEGQIGIGVVKLRSKQSEEENIPAKSPPQRQVA